MATFWVLMTPSILIIPRILVTPKEGEDIEEREKTELLNETDKDADLQALEMVISKGWPKKKSSLA